MIRAFVIRTGVLTIAFLVVDLLMDSVRINGGIVGAIGLAVVYGLVSAFLGTLLRLLSLPLILLTLGLFEVLINACLLSLTEWLTDWLEIDGNWSTIWAAILLSLTSMIVGMVLNAMTPDRRRS